MYKETLFEFKNDKNVSLAKVCTDQGVVPGIKLDAGTRPVPGFDGEGKLLFSILGSPKSG